jgi:hypothetical protein
MKDGKITVVEHEAEQVRLIYRRYLELSGVNRDQLAPCSNQCCLARTNHAALFEKIWFDTEGIVGHASALIECGVCGSVSTWVRSWGGGL